MVDDIINLKNVSPQHVILKAAKPLEGSPEYGTIFLFLSKGLIAIIPLRI
jgi:hypothetical protein